MKNQKEKKMTLTFCFNPDKTACEKEKKILELELIKYLIN